MTDVTRILSQIEDGDPTVAEQLLPLVYEELRRLAAARLANEKTGHTLQATALVHEAYLRLVGKEDAQDWNGRGHFFGAAAEAMRRILVERARRKRQIRRGGDRKRVQLDEGDAVTAESDDLLELDEALSNLERRDQVAAQVVKLRHFAGLTMRQTADAMNISLRTAERNWTYAKTWLHGELAADSDSQKK